MLYRLSRVGVVAALLAVALTSFADELADKGRAILDKNKSSVVTVRIVIKMQMSMSNFPSREEEMKSEATGTIIDPSGLTILSLNETDPSGMFEDMMAGRDGFEVKSTIGELKILQDDGTEIAAQVVLRDRDLDLAFIRPIEAPKDPLPAIDLSKAATPALLDPIVTINRLGRVANREYAVSLERINSIVSRPRTFFVMGNDPSQTALGCPAFSVDGDVIGLCVLRTVRGRESGGMGMFGGGDNNMMAIIVPAADVIEVAKQAPQTGEEAKELGEPEPKEEPSEDAPKDEAPREEAPAEGTNAAKPNEPAA